MEKSDTYREWIKDLVKEALREVLEEQRKEVEGMENLLEDKEDFTLKSIAVINNEKYIGYRIKTKDKSIDLKLEKGKSSRYGMCSTLPLDKFKDITIKSMRHDVLTDGDERTPLDVRNIILKRNIKKCKILLLTFKTALDDEACLFVYHT